MEQHELHEALAWLGGLERFSIRPGLERMEYLMEALGHPERRLKFIHIAGTNGKGSTAAFLDSILREAGQDIGLFTSPYIETFHSRIRYNGMPITTAELLDLIERIRPVVEEMRDHEVGMPTEFEVVTALALLYFATVTYPDIVIWETGLGGRLDSTNIVHPLASIITNVGLDHMNILGETRADIAREKAGIIKSGVPVIMGRMHPDALAVLEEVAQAKKATMYRSGREYTAERQLTGGREHLTFTGPFGRLENSELGLYGAHQADNAAAALMTIQVLRSYYALYVDDEHMRAGLAKASWPGRFERVAEKPDIIFDGAHNVDGIKALKQTLDEYYPEQPIRLVFSALGDKDYTQMVAELAPACGEVWIARTDHPRAAEPERIADAFRKASPALSVHVYESWKDAWEAACAGATPDDVILAAGSLYFISDVRNGWTQMKKAGDE